MKKYNDKNVYEASVERIEYIFKNFEKIYISFSGGKDSSVMLNLIIDYMRKNNITTKIGVLFIDLEGQYKLTIDHIVEMLDANKDIINPYWICLPLSLRNATSVFEPFWTCWDMKQKEKWIRQYPKYDIINEENHKFDFFKKYMEFEEFVVSFGRWYSCGKKTACLVGIRSDESLNRYRTIVSKTKTKIDGKNWTTKVVDNIYNCYPIYDWKVEDIWIGNYRFGWSYNKLYDFFYKAGVSLASQRICQPYGDDQRIGLNLFRVIEPNTWAKVVNRVSGANFGNIYSGNKILGYRNVKLPQKHTWKSYCKLLLATLPVEISEHYKKKFIKFMRYWNKKGCPIGDKDVENIPKQATITDKINNRVSKDKKTLIYKSIPDCLESNFESKKLAPTWRRMCICILKNDQLCKSLSFGQTKNQQERMKLLIDKYKQI